MCNYSWAPWVNGSLPSPWSSTLGITENHSQGTPSPGLQQVFLLELCGDEILNWKNSGQKTQIQKSKINLKQNQSIVKASWGDFRFGLFGVLLTLLHLLLYNRRCGSHTIDSPFSPHFVQGGGFGGALGFSMPQKLEPEKGSPTNLIVHQASRPHLLWNVCGVQTYLSLPSSQDLTTIEAENIWNKVSGFKIYLR